MTARDEQRAEQARRRILAEIARIGPILPGTLVTRKMRCGSPGCRCRGTEPRLHGPYVQWTLTRGRKTTNRWLDAEQQERYRAWIENYAKLRDLIARLEAVNIRAAERAEGWGA